MEDFNAKIGKGAQDNTVDPYGLGERNERGDRLKIFATQNPIAIMNIF